VEEFVVGIAEEWQMFCAVMLLLSAWS